MANTNPSMTNGTSTGAKSASSKAVNRKAAAGRSAAPRRRATKPARRSATSAARLMSKGKSALRGAYDWAGEAGSSINHASLPSAGTLRHVGESPLIIGAIGFGIGVLIASALPAMPFSKGSSKSNGRR
jgi:hypothetical protein